MFRSLLTEPTERMPLIHAPSPKRKAVLERRLVVSGGQIPGSQPLRARTAMFRIRKNSCLATHILRLRAKHHAPNAGHPRGRCLIPQLQRLFRLMIAPNMSTVHTHTHTHTHLGESQDRASHRRDSSATETPTRKPRAIGGQRRRQKERQACDEETIRGDHVGTRSTAWAATQT